MFVFASNAMAYTTVIIFIRLLPLHLNEFYSGQKHLLRPQ